MRDIIERLDAMRPRARLGSGQKRIDAQRAMGKLTAREQLERILGDVRADPMFFVCASDACFQRFGGGTSAVGRLFREAILMSGHRRACVWTFWLLLAACSLLGGCQTTRNFGLFAPASWTGLEALSDDVRVEATAGPEQRAQALRLRDEAYAQLNTAMGSVQSRPVHVFCFSDACYQGFGGGSPRAKNFGPHRTLIGPHAMTAAVVAHEWWHTDLYSRLGFWAWRKVPTWFDEGAAVWISDDPQYGEAMYQRVLAQGITPPTLDELATRDGFIAAVGRYGDHLWASKPPDAVKVVYPTAAREVRRWLQIVGTDGLRELVARLARGETFATAYAQLEAHGAGGR